MAILNKTGITNGGTIQSEHITRVIDALTGVSTDSLVLTGSLQGSATSAQTVNTITSALNYDFYPTFVDADNGAATPEIVYTDAGIRYNPSTNILITTASRAVSSSFAISSSRAVSSSFAATASYALNADASGEYVTLNFIHTPRTGTTTGTKTAFGIFPVGVTSESRIAAVTPFNCIIVSASLSTYCSTPGLTGQVNYDLVWNNGFSIESQSFGTVVLDNFIPTTLGEHRRYVGASMDAGRNIYIKMTDGTTDASVVYSSHMAVLLKKV
jgi:hypothetical protein